MAAVEKVSVALSPELLEMVKGAVASGRYGSASEVIREALREWRLRQPLRGRSGEAAQGLDRGAGERPIRGFQHRGHQTESPQPARRRYQEIGHGRHADHPQPSGGE